METTDVRARLAEALGAHGINRYGQHDGWWECLCDPDQPFSPEHLVDVILAAPGVTTIALPEPTSTREDDEDDESAHRLGWWQNGSPYYITQWGYPNEVQIAYDGEALEPINVSEARFLAAALLAAADAAEAANNG